VYAVVAQLAARKPVLARKLEAFASDPKGQAERVCTAPEWQREPLRVTFRAAGHDAASFEVVPGSAMLVEDSADDTESAPPAAKANE
jgi:hypothetical protein